MKFRHFLFLTALSLGIATFAANPCLATFLLLFLGTFLVGNLLTPQSPKLCVTLTVAEIMNDILQAFKTRVPALNFFAHDYSSDSVMLNQQIIAHLPVVPTAYDHVAASGYSNNAQSARSLLTDVPITIDGWKDVPIKIAVTDASQDRNKNYLKTIGNAGYVLGKAVADFALTKAVAANFSEETVETISNTTRDTLGKVRVAMNGKKAGTPRYMLTNSDFFNALDNDARIASRDYYGQETGADPFGRLRNVSGFAEIVEYPDFPDNSEDLNAFAFDERAVGIATRLPKDSTELAQQLGLPVTYKSEIVTDPETGLSIAGFGWIDQNTHDIFIVSSVMFGAVAGSQGGSAGAKTDYAGHRVVETT
jgi:hypothetical protein